MIGNRFLSCARIGKPIPPLCCISLFGARVRLVGARVEPTGARLWPVGARLSVFGARVGTGGARVGPLALDFTWLVRDFGGVPWFRLFK